MTADETTISEQVSTIVNDTDREHRNRSIRALESVSRGQVYPSLFVRFSDVADEIAGGCDNPFCDAVIVALDGPDCEEAERDLIAWQKRHALDGPK